MSGLALLAAAGVLAAGLIAAIALLRLRTVHGRLIGLALVVGALPLGAVLLTGIAMFDMHANVVLISVGVASSVVAVVGAWLLTRSISRPLHDLRTSTARLSGGDFGARVSGDGPTELAEVGEAFNEMAEKLEELFDARAELVAWASHDLRAPVSSLGAMLEAVEDGVVEPEHYLPEMRQQVRRLGSLIDDLFELARIDANGEPPETRGVPVERLVASSLDGFVAVAAARGVALERLIDVELPEVDVAPKEIERVMQNLLENALRHTPPEGSVRVAAERSNGSVVVSIEDTGVGLPAGATNAMFDRFWRGDRARDLRQDGAGLGLAIAKGLVERHGGTIWAEERTGGGARVAFTLPVA